MPDTHKMKLANSCIKFAKLTLKNSLVNENTLLKKVLYVFENLLKNINCPKCKRPFTQRGEMCPRMVTCGHTYCGQCCQSGFSCPLCIKMTVKSETPINFYLTDLMLQIGKIFLEKMSLKHQQKRHKNCFQNKKSSLVEEFRKIVRCIRTHKYAFIAPRNFKILITKYGFKADCQHDCQELLTCLLNNFHDELKGKLTNETLCKMCTKMSVSSQDFYILNLPIPLSGTCSLQDCFTTFFKIERIDKWTCSSCKAPREAEIAMQLTKMPPILIIALNRFEYGDRFCRKKDNLVTYPVKLFLHSEKEKKQYQLYGTINHAGSLNQGHYTASSYDAGAGKWINFDDKVIHEMPSLDIVGHFHCAKPLPECLVTGWK